MGYVPRKSQPQAPRQEGKDPYDGSMSAAAPAFAVPHAERVALRKARRNAGLSLDALSLRTGVTRSTLWRIERGEQVPRPSTALRIARALGLGVEQVRELAGGDDPEPPSALPLDWPRD